MNMQVSKIKSAHTSPKKKYRRTIIVFLNIISNITYDRVAKI